MPYRFMRSVEPIVRHGLRELRLGLPIDHVLREVTLMGALVGTGESPRRAIRTVERLEPRLLGLARGEAGEWYHRGYTPYWRHMRDGYGMPYGYGADMNVPVIVIG